MPAPFAGVESSFSPAMADVSRSGGLQTIFSFFMGLMVTAFVGVGVYTFYPSPEKDLNRRIQDLSRREEGVRNSRPADEMTTEDREQIQEINTKRDELSDAAQKAREAWGRITSIILVVFATLVMAVSLIRADHLPVISNGLLLGGLFTMVYGVGWIVATDTSVARFAVMTVALLTTLALGYTRFVRRRTMTASADGAGGPSGEGLADIEQRVRDLERRLNEASDALRHKGDSPGP